MSVGVGDGNAHADLDSPIWDPYDPAWQAMAQHTTPCHSTARHPTAWRAITLPGHICEYCLAGPYVVPLARSCQCTCPFRIRLSKLKFTVCYIFRMDTYMCGAKRAGRLAICMVHVYTTGSAWYHRCCRGDVRLLWHPLPAVHCLRICTACMQWTASECTESVHYSPAHADVCTCSHMHA